MKTLIRVVAVALLAVPAVSSACGPYGAEGGTAWEVQHFARNVQHAKTSGQLTAREAVVVDRHLHQLQQTQRRLADPLRSTEVTSAERRHLRRLIDRSTRVLGRLSSNRDTVAPMALAKGAPASHVAR